MQLPLVGTWCRRASVLLVLIGWGLSALAQTTYDTVQWWNLAVYKAQTLENLAVDTGRWTPMLKSGTLQRYANKVVTDGLPLVANGQVIEETQGLLVGAGMEAGTLLLRHNMGSSQNGLQMQRLVPVSIPGLKAGQRVVVTMKSSSSTAQGIAEVSNLSGEVGASTYPATYFKTYTFDVIEDGDVSWTNSGGVVIQRVGVLAMKADLRDSVATPVIRVDGRLVTLTCPTPGASIKYALVDHARVLDYAQPYTGPFELTRACRIRAIAQKEGMRDSDVADTTVTVTMNWPFAGKPWVLDPEPLDRGVVATYMGTGSQYLINWRWKADDPADVSFDVFRNGLKINTSPVRTSTNFVDVNGGAGYEYRVDACSEGAVFESATAMMLPKGYWDIALNRPAGGVTATGEFEYIPGDCMVADVDGDKAYEVVMKWDPSNRKDNSESGVTGNVLIDAYRLDGTQLWRIDLGKNIRAGAHYTQLMVYDLDGDGKAEVACKTAPGTIDGKGQFVVMGQDDPQADYRATVSGKDGIIITGPEYLTVFSGLTGEALATTAYRPGRDTIADWGDTYGNRCERYLACVAYLDGVKPSLVMCRGYYTASFLWAVDFDGVSLNTRWLHGSTKGGIGAYGEGAHSLSTADVDGDGRDEIVYGACVVDDDGTLIYRTGLGHGDAMHVGDFVPDRPGLEVMMVHEEVSAKYGVEMHDALTGEVLAGVFTGTDVGRGLCADIDAASRGHEYWSTASGDVYSAAGVSLSTKRPSVNFRTYWDGDLLDEITESGVITEWVGRTSNISTLVNMPTKYGAGTNVIKYTPCLQADIFGDWREEQIYYDNATKSHLWIFATPYATPYRVPTLMHDHHYRMATVWQTAAYNQPPHLSYALPDYVSYLTDLEPVYGTGPGADGVSPGADGAAQGADGAVRGALIRTNYYNLLGQPLPDQPDRGLFIEERVFANGGVVRVKVLK